MTDDPQLSVVVPLFNEEPNVAPLVRSVQDALAGRRWELLLIDDGSTDETAVQAEEAAERDPRIRLIRLARNYGQATAMQAGFERARGQIVVTMDGDLQNDPRDIPRLLARMEEGYDVVAGRRVNRKDPFLTRTLPSLVANALIRRISGTSLADNGCSLKAYRRGVLARMHLYSDLHRFIAPLAAGTVGARVDQVDVRHHRRRRGRSKYGLSRTWKVLADLLTVMVLRSFRERPLVLFGFLASVLVVVGTASGVASVTMMVAGPGPYFDPSFVLPTVGLLCLEVAAFLLMLGLIAEVALRGRWNRQHLMAPVALEWGDER